MIEDQRKYACVLIQAEAATRPSPFEATLTRLTRLKLQKPTQAMDETSISVFLEDLADMLEQDGYCYQAIDEGITKLIKMEKDKWFPTYDTLRKYIYPIHYKYKRRADKLGEMLGRPTLRKSHKEIE